MHGPLETLLADGVVEEICGRLKSGKEADLWLVRHAGEIVAAKVYKARQARSFRNNAAYKEGRQVRSTRTQRAMDRGSRFGQASAEEAWKAKEADALHKLHAAGVRVPRPVLFYEGVLLMELVVDSHGRPAPRLVETHLTRDLAAPLYADLREQAVRMLGCDLIHADLSPYNVLLGARGPVVIDFPQVVGAAHNSQAEAFFHRDLENLRRFFAAIDPALRSAANDAREIWRAYVRRELAPGFVPSGRASPAPPREAHRHGHAEPRGSRPHGWAATRDHLRRPERSDHPGRGRPHEGPGASRMERQGRHPSAAPGRREPGGAPDRRRAAPGPEVIRIVRPPLVPLGKPAAVQPPAPVAAPLAVAADRSEDGRTRRRRRRRRR
jgi:RIO kinase 1